MKQKLIKRAIGGSTIGAIVGVNKYVAPIDVWETLVNGTEYHDTEASRWGRALEPVIRQRYAEEHACDITVPTSSLAGAPRPFDHVWRRATPDGLCRKACDQWGLEIKTANHRMAHLWGEEGSDDIPASYLCQCQWNLDMTGLDRWDVAALIGGSDYREYIIHRDDDLIGMLREAAERFWRDYVETKTPPPPDASRSYAKHLHRRYPRALSETYLDSTPDIDATLARLMQAKAIIREAKADAQRCENELTAIIGEARGIVSEEYGRFTWAHRKGSPRWKDIAKEIADLAGLTITDDVLNEHRSEPTRVLYTPRRKDPK